jgi:outer membrane protein TolC
MMATARRRALAAVIFAALAAASCAHEMSGRRTAPGTSPLPATPWTPPADLAPSPAAPAPAAGKEGAVIPSDLLANAANWTLTDLLDLALRNAPQTRIAWAQARSAAAALGAEKGAYYPTVVGQVNTVRTKASAVGGQFTYLNTSYDPFLQINWLLLDFGGRSNNVESARQALVAADWSHNAAIQDVVLEVEQTYYGYLDARALEAAGRVAVEEAAASLDAAERRRASGVSTIADVLQAKTDLSQAQLVLQTVQGQILTIHGGLATAVGLPADTPFEVTLPLADVPEEEAAVQIDRAIAEAQTRRPDLAAARARVDKAAADLRARTSLIRPTLNLSSNAGRIYYNQIYSGQDTYSASALLTIPIFNGLTYQYNVHKAKADRDTAQAQLDSLAQQVTLDVWTSYYDHQTASQQVKTSRDLLESARQSHEVVAARYKAGVGSILDLLTAQGALDRARALETQARTAWFVTLARLAHATGTLWQPTANGSASAIPEDKTP